MTSTVDSVAKIDSSKESWCLHVRIVRLWSLSYGSSKLPSSLEMVLLDEFGDKIHATVRRTLVFKFMNVLHEGEAYEMSHFGVGQNNGNFKTTRHKYKLNFEHGTIVKGLSSSNIPTYGFTFTKMDDIMKKGFDTSYLVDFMGMLSHVGPEKESEKEGKIIKYIVIDLQVEGSKIECTLFGTYIDQLNAFLSSGDVSNTVVIIQFARVKNYQGKVSIQNSFFSTKIFFNLDDPVVVNFKNSATTYYEGLSQLQDSGSCSLEDDFLQNIGRKTIEELKDCKEDCFCIVLATIKHILDGEDGEDWWYPSCKCNRSVYPLRKTYFCEACDVKLLSVTPRYKINVRVIDNFDSCSFVIFEKEASNLLKKSCHDFLQSMLKPGARSTTPKELLDLIDKTFLFKIEVKVSPNQNFHNSYRVKRMTDDSKLIEKFKASAPASIDVDCTVSSIPLCKHAIVVEGDGGLHGKNLITEFCAGEADNVSSFGESCDRDLVNNAADLTPCKRPSEETAALGEEDSFSCKLKKTIKQEKID